jgi:hypothetical protein
MSNGAYDRRIFYPLARWRSGDSNLEQSQLDESLRNTLLQLLGPRLSSSVSYRSTLTQGFIGESFQVRPTDIASSNVKITAGIGFIEDDLDVPVGVGGIVGLNDVSPLKPLVLKADQTITVTAPPAFPNNRIDIIEVRANRDLFDSEVIRVLDVFQAKLLPASELMTLSFALDGLVGTVATPAASTAPIGYKTGVAAASPVAPPTTSGYVKIAEVYVANAVANPTGLLTFHYVSDFRPYLFAGGRAAYAVSTETTPGAVTPPSQVYLDAPPGLRMAICTDSYVGGEFDLYLIGNIGSASYASVFSTDTAGTYDIRDLYFGAPGVITAGERTALESANTYPAGFLVNEGAPRIRIKLTPYDGGAAPAAPVTLKVSGSVGER